LALERHRPAYGHQGQQSRQRIAERAPPPRQEAANALLNLRGVFHRRLFQPDFFIKTDRTGMEF
jgi:hypothetical protein